MNKHSPPDQPEFDTGQEHINVPVSLCALARAIGEVGDGWTLLILREVLCGATRFDTMQKELGISRAVLTKRLSLLVDREILVRNPIHEPGRRRQHNYLLTPKGRGLIPALVALREWSQDFIPGPESPLHLRTKNGKDIEVRLTTTDGRRVNPGEIVASIEE